MPTTANKISPHIDAETGKAIKIALKNLPVCLSALLSEESRTVFSLAGPEAYGISLCRR